MFYKHIIIYPNEGSRSLSSPLGLKVPGSQMTGLWSFSQEVAELELFRVTAMEHWAKFQRPGSQIS